MVTLSAQGSSLAPALSMEVRSLSMAISLPPLSLRAICSECPPSPSVPSTYMPSGLIFRYLMHSSRSTGTCPVIRN